MSEVSPEELEEALPNPYPEDEAVVQDDEYEEGVEQ